MAVAAQPALTTDEREGICLAVQSAFTKLKNLYQKIRPIFESYGFTAPSAGVIARDLSEKIETAIVQHCPTFEKGTGYCDLARYGSEWEVKICKDSGLTINQSKQIHGENYIVVNYKAQSQVTRIWVLWNATDALFSPRSPRANARALRLTDAGSQIEILYQAKPEPATAEIPRARARPAKAGLRHHRRAGTA